MNVETGRMFIGFAVVFILGVCIGSWSKNPGVASASAGNVFSHEREFQFQVAATENDGFAEIRAERVDGKRMLIFCVTARNRNGDLDAGSHVSEAHLAERIANEPIAIRAGTFTIVFQVTNNRMWEDARGEDVHVTFAPRG